MGVLLLWSEAVWNTRMLLWNLIGYNSHSIVILKVNTNIVHHKTQGRIRRGDISSTFKRGDNSMCVPLPIVGAKIKKIIKLDWSGSNITIRIDIQSVMIDSWFLVLRYSRFSKIAYGNKILKTKRKKYITVRPDNYLSLPHVTCQLIALKFLCKCNAFKSINVLCFMSAPYISFFLFLKFYLWVAYIVGQLVSMCLWSLQWNVEPENISLLTEA
jgi:hypothetical protein